VSFSSRSRLLSSELRECVFVSARRHLEGDFGSRCKVRRQHRQFWQDRVINLQRLNQASSQLTNAPAKVGGLLFSITTKKAEPLELNSILLFF